MGMKLYAVWDTEKGGWWDHEAFFRRCDAANHWNAVNERRRYSPAYVSGGWKNQTRYITRETVLQPVEDPA